MAEERRSINGEGHGKVLLDLDFLKHQAVEAVDHLRLAGRRTCSPSEADLRTQRFCSGDDPVRNPASRAVIIADATP